jgi:hypothetical protein
MTNKPRDIAHVILIKGFTSELLNAHGGVYCALHDAMCLIAQVIQWKAHWLAKHIRQSGKYSSGITKQSN